MNIQVFHGDCLTFMKDLPDKSVDLFLCDLPYGCLTGGGGKEKKKRGEGNVIGGCSWDIPIDLEEFWKQVRRLRKSDHSPCIHFCTAKFGYDLIKSNEKEFRYDLIWEKTNAVGFLSANKMPMRSHETIYIFSKAGAYYKRQDISGNFPEAGGGRTKSNVYGGNFAHLQPSNEGKRCVKSVFEFANRKQKNGHPTAKPIELYKFLIERYCPKGGTILDPTAGSFNSGKASKELGFHYIGIEKNKDFFDRFSKME
jgi:site-specific DNA-methyltransferase (adenine-specific)